MTPVERQELIMATLRTQRKARISNLAVALGCSERTIYRDIDTLTLSFPLKTVQGRYTGGVELEEWYKPRQPVLNPEQILALRTAMKTADSQTKLALSSIISQFSPFRND